MLLLADIIFKDFGLGSTFYIVCFALVVVGITDIG